MKNLITCLVVSSISGATFADTWTVDDDGKADFDNIQTAVDAASDGDEILVMPGTYTGTGNSVINTTGTQLRIYSSEGPETTIIDGEESRRGIECSSDETNETIFEGFTITRGTFVGSTGGGLYCKNASPVFINCTFENNTAGTNGGGAHCSNGAPTFNTCRFISNTASRGAGVNTFRSAVTFNECLFVGNQASAWGGGIYSYGTSSSGTALLLSDCTFEDNTSISGAGIYCNDASHVVSDCIFLHNIANDAGGGMFNNHSSNPIITNCSFRLNEALTDTGGGIRSVNGSNPGIGDSYFCSNYHNGGNIGGNIWGSYDDLGGNEELEQCPVCQGDVDGNGIVDVTDIIAMISAWGCTTCGAEDVNGDGIVEVNDIVILIGNWGPCE